jgi:hypothetical protein
MSRLLDRVASAASGSGLLWLDANDYASALLANGAPPWLDVAATLAWQRKAQGLLRSDVVSLPLAVVIDAWLAQNPALRTAMAAKSRLLAPLKVLLADEALRAHLAEMVRGMRAGFGDSVLALLIPSPRYWPALSYAQAFGADQPAEVTATMPTRLRCISRISCAVSATPVSMRCCWMRLPRRCPSATTT